MLAFVSRGEPLLHSVCCKASIIPLYYIILYYYFYLSTSHLIYKHICLNKNLLNSTLYIPKLSLRPQQHILVYNIHCLITLWEKHLHSAPICPSRHTNINLPMSKYSIPQIQLYCSQRLPLRLVDHHPKC